MGLVHIYCGEGKGKTTAAIGLAVRMASYNKKILFHQFMKNQKASERIILFKIDNITVSNGFEMKKFSFQMTEEEKNQTVVEFKKDFENIILQSNNYDMIILDEIMSCISCGFLDLDSVIGFVKNKPENLELVLTGRDPDEKLCELADYVSEIQKIKHPYDKGIMARKGIEY